MSELTTQALRLILSGRFKKAIMVMTVIFTELIVLLVVRKAPCAMHLKIHFIINYSDNYFLN